MAILGSVRDHQDDRDGMFSVFMLDLERIEMEYQLDLEGIETESPEFPSSFASFRDGWVWDRASRRILVAHGASDKITVADLEEGRILEQTLIRPQSDGLGMLLDWLVGTAEAKLAPGIDRVAALSPDGRRLYLAGQRREMYELPNDFWSYSETPLNFRVVDTENMSEIAEFDIPASRVYASPDGRWIFVSSEARPDVDGGEVQPVVGSGLHVFDAETLKL